MAFAIDTRSNTAALKLDLSHGIYELMQRFEDYRAYRRTVAELSALSSHELSDLGLNQSTIRAAAHEAVYGARA